MECRVNECYACVLGESLGGGLPTFLIRLSGCNLDCRYCDTRYARTEPGSLRSVDLLREDSRAARLGRVLLTGGEPMLQHQAAIALCEGLLDDGIEVHLETNGTLPLGRLPSEVIKVVDVKTPGALGIPAHGATPFLESNLPLLGPADQLKLVLTSPEDYRWAVAFLEARSPLPIPPGNVLFSPAWGLLRPVDLADWMLADRLPYRFHLQLHKVVWGEKRKV